MKAENWQEGIVRPGSQKPHVSILGPQTKCPRPIVQEDLQFRKREATGWEDAFNPSRPGSHAAHIAYRTYMGVLMLRDSIDVDRERRHGIPVLKGTRFTASQVLAQIADGDSLQDLTDGLQLDHDILVNFLRGLSIILDHPHVP
ncbi:MAG: DUF433 domain-containing protein [Planctomycetaceae bacterium]